ncbi:MAG: nuclear transport factor 2 family protein [Actinomycetota bacterium]
MDAQETMRLMLDTMDAYDRGDFERLGEIHAEDAHWLNSDPQGPHCDNRDAMFDMFRGRMETGIRVVFDEMRSTPTHVALAVTAPDFASITSIFTFEGRRIVHVADYGSMDAAVAAIRGPDDG